MFQWRLFLIFLLK